MPPDIPDLNLFGIDCEINLSPNSAGRPWNKLIKITNLANPTIDDT